MKLWPNPGFRVFKFTTLLTVSLMAIAPLSRGAEAAKTPPAPTMEQRMADVEAYINNTGRTPDVASKVAGPGPGHNAWLLTSSALVLFMTLPGLALFYGGLVRRKNVLSVLAQCMAITGLVTILWWAVGYSFVFGNGSPYLGNLQFAFLKGVDGMPNTNYSYWVSQNVFSMFQLMFAIITPALIVGAIAERMKFTAIVTFIGLWMLVVYFPLAHMVWGIDGLMNGVWNADAKIAAIDFAGGMVVHMSSGWSALVLCLILGPRIGFGKEPMAPHNMVLCMVGTGMLWVGWYGFNAGSAVAADVIAGAGFLNTTLAAAVASFSWATCEYIMRRKASVLGFCSGAVAGLVVITPAAGFVTPNGAVIIGVLAGVIPFQFCMRLKAFFGYDDALDTFGVHAIGGTLGALLTGILASPTINGNLLADVNAAAKTNGLAAAVANGTLWIDQCKAIGVTLILSTVGTAVIAYCIKGIMGLRPSAEVEEQGLDINEHGEEGYSN